MRTIRPEATVTFATFILSTGRCGTQWLATQLTRYHGATLAIEHEPLHNNYEPRKLLRRSEPCDTSHADLILNHADAIERRLESGPYLECGHTCWAAIPFFARRFPGRVRVVHLIRHPVPTACSLVTHNCYCPPLLPDIHSEKIPLSRLDDGVRYPEYRDIWATLPPFEKCLYYWLEVNAFGKEAENRLGVPWLRLRYEDLFWGDGLQHLTNFLGLPWQESLHAQRNEYVDNYRHLTYLWSDVRSIDRHASVLALARECGYESMTVDETALRRRYIGI